MYILNGFGVWVVLLFVILMVLKFGGHVVNDKENWAVGAADLAAEFREAPIHTIGIFGIVSVIVIGAWPIILTVMALAFAAFLIGGVPYIVFTRTISTPKQEK